MSRAKQVFIIFTLASLGLWGCTQGPAANRSANVEQIKSLEGRISKLEEDFRAAASARDQFRQKLATVEDQRNQLQKEREELRKQVIARTSERDSLQVQYEGFRKNIRDLVGQAEAAAAGPSQPVTSAVELSNPGKS